MAERIELPSMPQGRPEEQLQNLYSYMYRLAQTLNINLSSDTMVALTDDEQILMNQLTYAINSENRLAAQMGFNGQEQETLKSLIIKTAEYVKTETDAYRMVLFGETAASSEFGNYIQKKGVKVDVTPDGIKQTYSFSEVVKGLKTFEVNSKNYIKTGFLRTESGLPVYGVAIGKDVVTFSEDGTETYHDANKVAELTADELSFFQNGYKLASYTGNSVTFYNGGYARLRIDSTGITFLNGSTKLAEILNTALKFYYSGTLRAQMDTDGVKLYNGSTMTAQFNSNKLSFYSGGTEIFYIQNGKLYSGADLEISTGSGVKMGYWKIADDGLTYTNPSESIGFEISDWNDMDLNVSGIYKHYTTNSDGILSEILIAPGSYKSSGVFRRGGFHFSILQQNNGDEFKAIYPRTGGTALDSFLGTQAHHWDGAYIDDIEYVTMTQSSSRDIKHDIRDLPDPGEKIDGLRPVTFIYDRDPEERRRTGLIYEETAEVMPEICSGIESDKRLNYLDLIPVLLKEVQNLRARVRELEERTGG